MQEKGNDNAAWWCAEMLGALEEGSVRAGQGKGRSWYRVGMRQVHRPPPSLHSIPYRGLHVRLEVWALCLSFKGHSPSPDSHPPHHSLSDSEWCCVWWCIQLSGMLVAVFARTELAPHIGDAQTAAVATGVLGVGANKGGVALRFLLFRRSVCVLCSHFAAHQVRLSHRVSLCLTHRLSHRVSLCLSHRVSHRVSHCHSLTVSAPGGGGEAQRRLPRDRGRAAVRHGERAGGSTAVAEGAAAR